MTHGNVDPNGDVCDVVHSIEEDLGTHVRIYPDGVEMTVTDDWLDTLVGGDRLDGPFFAELDEFRRPWQAFRDFVGYDGRPI